jgi:mannose-1-phosphate guanylyltransferase
VTFGVKPTSASAAYGYIQPGEALDGEVRAAARFVEKPAAADASALIEAGWLWNSGNFLFRADVMLEELSAHAPGILDAVAGARDSGQRDGEVLALGESFLDAPSLAIDVAVMETTARGAVLGVDYAWSDLGAWDAVWAAAPHDVDGNAVQGSAAVMVECRDSLVRGPPGARIVAVGLKNIAVVVEGDRILVCELTKAQSISPAVAAVEDL